MRPSHSRSCVSLAKAAGLSVGIAAGVLSLTQSWLQLELKRVVAQTQPQRPNVVVIMADDLSVGELNQALSKGWMPNLEMHLVNRGTTFKRSFVSDSLCCPSRATFLTGQYPHNHNVLDNTLPEGGVTRLNDTSTLATWLQRVGYRTGLIGKHLNGYGRNKVADNPSDDPTYIPPGWDDWQALVITRFYNYPINDNGKLIDYGADSATPPEEYLTDVLAQRSVNFINTSEVNDSTPFFLFITPFAPHVPADPAPRHAGTGSTISLPQLPSFNEPDLSDKPASLQNPQLGPRQISGIQQVYRHKLESLRAVDDLVGRVVYALAENRELDRSVLVFTADNGFLFGEHRLIAKTHVYEESIQVPLLIRAPGFAQQSVSQLVINNDLAPTIADFAGATPDIPVDGRSLLPLLQKPNLSGWRRRFLVENRQPSRKKPLRAESQTYFAVRTDRSDTATPNQLYAEYAAGDREFYDLAIDPDQLQSLHNQEGRRQQIQILQNHLKNLKDCSGESCRTAEDR